MWVFFLVFTRSLQQSHLKDQVSPNVFLSFKNCCALCWLGLSSYIYVLFETTHVSLTCHCCCYGKLSLPSCLLCQLTRCNGHVTLDAVLSAFLESILEFPRSDWHIFCVRAGCRLCSLPGSVVMWRLWSGPSGVLESQSWTTGGRLVRPHQWAFQFDKLQPNIDRCFSSLRQEFNF